MLLKKFINNQVTKFLTENKLLNEYITREEIYLKDYLSMSEDAKKAYLPHEYWYFFRDFLIEKDYDFEMPQEKVDKWAEDDGEDEYEDMFDNDIELIIWLERNDNRTYQAFADYLYQKITDNELSIPVEEYPAWHYFSDDPELVKNQWLIHFTKDADSISREGFKYGISEAEKLGLTTHMSEFEKKYGGYNFSYLVSDFKRYYQGRHGNKYGDEAVVFRASGIQVWHYSDNEPQVIFYGNTAKNIIPITEGENNKYAIYSSITGKRLIEHDDIETIVYWVIRNYDQYRKHFNYS